jgi:predicted permease
MRRLRGWLLRLGGLFGREQRERELAAEMESHLQMHIEDNLRAGMSSEIARREALMKLGGVEQIKENYRERRGLPLLETLFQDLRFAARMLRKNTGLTFIVVLTFALGIGVNVSVFSLMDFVLLRPLDVPDPDRMTVLTRAASPMFSYPDYIDLRDRNTSFKTLAASNLTESSLDYQGESPAAAAETISANYAEALETHAFLGRWISDENEPVAVISYDIWQRLFSGDANALGKQVLSESQWYTVIGVAPPEFTGLFAPLRTDVWVPLPIWANQYPAIAAQMKDRTRPRILIFGRLKDGVERTQAAANLGAIVAHIRAETGGVSAASAPIVVEAVRGAPNPNSHRGAVPVLVLLFAVVGAVLLIACVNVSNLLLARGIARQRELSLRLTLGAGRARLLRQLLTETFLLSLLGTAGGLLVGHWTNVLMQSLLRSLPVDAPIEASLQIDLRVFLFAAITAFGVTVISGVLPAWRASKVNISLTLKGESPSASRFRFGHASMVAQVALSLTLLLCAGLFLRSLARMRTAEPGFAVENHLFASVYVPEREFTPDQGRHLFARVVENLRVLPGVRRTALAQDLPLFSGGTDCVSAGNGVPLQATYGTIDSGFLATMHIPLLEGREFISRDAPAAAHVVIVNQTLARQLWPNQRAVGERVRIGCGSASTAEVVGVARDTKVGSLTAAPQPHFYQPFSQNYTSFVTIALETAGDPVLVARAVRRKLHAENKSIGIYAVEPIANRLARSYWQLRWEAFLLLVFGMLALLLAGIGLFGVISYHAAQRTQEIGVRCAMGAQQHDVLRLILGQGLRLTLIGVGIGLGVSLGLTRLIARFLAGLNPADPLTFAGASVLWLLVAAFACYLPARRASRVDPMVALRYE